MTDLGKILSCIGAEILLSGCASMKEITDYVTPSFLQSAEEFQIIDDTDAFYKTAEPVAAWWDKFDDPIMSALVQQSLDTNLDVRVALANLEEARAIARASGYDYFPTVTSGASYARTRLTERGVSGASADRTVNLHQAGFDANWELDLFGRVSQGIAAEKARADAALSGLQDIYVSVAAETARTYIDLRGAQYRLDIARRNTENQQETYDLTLRLAEGGRATALDTARAQTQLDLTRATIPPLEAAVQATIHRLSVLTGQLPDALAADLKDHKMLPSLPDSVYIGTAAELLKRRPDIRSAESTLAAAVASYNISVTELFPVVSFTGTIGYSATDFADIGNSSALTWSAGPSISWRAFDIARVRQEIKRDDARAMAALALYEKTILTALEEVKTSMSDYTQEEKRRAILRGAAASSQKAAEIARIRFDQGVDGFLDVLDSERTRLQAEDSLAQSEIGAALDLIAIYKALGGGWQIKSPYVAEQ